MASLYPGAPPAVTASAKSAPPAKAPPKATPTPRSAATQAPPAAPAYTPLTPAQQVAQATAEAHAKQAASLAGLATTSKENQQAAAAGQQTAAASSKALASILQSIAPATYSPYNQAAQADDAFSKGFSTGLSHIQGQTQGEANQFLSMSGGQAQAPQIAAQIGGTDVTDPLQYTTGYIPATTLEREGAAFGAAAANLPAQALGIGQQQGQQVRNQLAAAQQKVADSRATLAANLPNLIDASLNRIGTQQLSLQKVGQAQANADRNFTLAADKFDWQQTKDALAAKLQTDKAAWTQAYQTANLTGVVPGTKGTLTVAAQKAVTAANQAQQRLVDEQSRIDESVAHNRVSEAQATQRLKIATAKYNASVIPTFSATNTNALHFQADQYGKPIGGVIVPQAGYRLNAAGTGVIKDPKAVTRAAVKTLSAQGRKTAIANAYRAANLMLNGGPVDATGKAVVGGGYQNVGTAASPQIAALPAVGFQQAIVEMQQQGYFSTPEYRKIAMKALRDTYGGLEKAAAGFGSSVSSVVQSLGVK